MASAKKAKTAQELKEKYQKKRLTPDTAAKYYLYNYLYWMYLINENKEVNALKDKVLNDDTPVYNLLLNPQSGGKALALYNIYGNLCEWFNTAFDSAVLMRNTLRDYIMMFASEALFLSRRGIMGVAAENIKKILERQEQERETDMRVSVWINVFTDKHRNEPNKQLFLSIPREGIERNLRYLNAYNTLVSIISKQIKVPELTLLQVDMDGVDSGLRNLNDSLKTAREALIKREAGLSEKKEIEAALKYLAPVPGKAPPIPQENLSQAENTVKTILSTQSNFTWSMAFKLISLEYWRR